MKVFGKKEIAIAVVMMVMLGACNSKSTQEETNTSNPTTQTTGDTSANDGATGGTNTDMTGSTTASSGGSSNGTDDTTNNSNDSTTGTSGGTTTSSGDSGSSTGNTNTTESNTSTSTNDNNTSTGSDTNTTTGGDDNTTSTPTVTLASLKLTVDKTSLNKDENTTVKVMATYSDNSTKEVTGKVAWIVTPSDAVKVTDTTLTALQDKAVVVKAKMNTVSSDAVSLKITWIVNGHVLPPEPDPVENDATLLGVDSNNDGVRDDIERKVYATYPKAIQRAVMMQAFRVEQKMLADPDMVDNAREWAKEDTKAMDCDAYLYLHKNKPFIKKMGNVINNWQFNNEERVKLYIRYNKALSGGVYTINEGVLQDCEFDVDKVLEMDK